MVIADKMWHAKKKPEAWGEKWWAFLKKELELTFVIASLPHIP